MSSINSCSENTKALAKAIEELTGTPLPDCPTIYTAEDGTIVASSTNALGTTHIVEINEDGVFRSNFCGDEVRHDTRLIAEPGGSIRSVPACKDFNRVKQSGPMSTEKLAHAREVILQSKKAAANSKRLSLDTNLKIEKTLK